MTPNGLFTVLSMFNGGHLKNLFTNVFNFIQNADLQNKH